MEDAIGVVLPLFKELGPDAMLVVVAATLVYIAKGVRKVTKSLEVNPGLGQHLQELRSGQRIANQHLAAISKNGSQMARRVEDVWGAVKNV